MGRATVLKNDSSMMLREDLFLEAAAACDFKQIKMFLDVDADIINSRDVASFWVVVLGLTLVDFSFYLMCDCFV